jgi:hypothetical protein
MTVFSNVYLAVDAVAPHLNEVEKRERTNSFHSPSQSRRCGETAKRVTSGFARETIALLSSAKKKSSERREVPNGKNNHATVGQSPSMIPFLGVCRTGT